MEELSYILEGFNELDALFYFPDAINGELQRENPLANYVFVQSSLPDKKLLKLERSGFVDTILCMPGSVGNFRKINRVTEAEISSTLEQQEPALELKVGTQVRIETGAYDGFTGIVVEIFGDKVKVFVELHSRKRLVDLSRRDVILQD